MSGGSAAAVSDAQALAAEEAKVVEAQCYKTDGATAVVVRLTERNGDSRQQFLPWNEIKM